MQKTFLSTRGFAGKKEIIDRIAAAVKLDRSKFFGDFIAAPNDFERMWILCCRYLAAEAASTCAKLPADAPRRSTVWRLNTV